MDAGLRDASSDLSAESPDDDAMNTPPDLLAALCTGHVGAKEGEEIARKALNLDGRPQWSIPLALALYQQQEYQKAIEVLRFSEKECSPIVDWNILAGMVARQLPNHEELAKNFYRRALEIDPTRPDIYYNLGNLLKEDEPEEAEILYRKSINLDPDSATVWHNFGISLNNQNRFVEALQPFRYSLTLDPYISDVWCNLGLAYFGIESFQQAESCFRKSISLLNAATSSSSLAILS